MFLSDAIIERAAYFYRKASEKKLIRGRTVKGIVYSSIMRIENIIIFYIKWMISEDLN